MEIAGALIDKGVRPDFIIDETFYKKTYIQNQILGRALMESILLLNGKIIFSAIKKKDMDFYGIDSKDLEGVIDQLRVTEGVECALFSMKRWRESSRSACVPTARWMCARSRSSLAAADMCGQPDAP